MDNFRSEVILSGKIASPGLVMGKAHIFDQQTERVSNGQSNSGDIQIEKKKIDHALQKVITELYNIAHFAGRNAKDKQALNIIEAQKEITNDPDLYKKMIRLIEKKSFNAAQAVHQAFQTYINLIEKSDKDFVISRLPDVKDIRDRLIRNIQQSVMISSFHKNAIIIARELSPTDIVLLARHNVSGAVVDFGGLTSHAAIIANSMGIPMIIDTKIASKTVRDGDLVVINGPKPELIVRPNSSRKKYFKQLIAQRKEVLKKEVNDEIIPSTTRCGKKFKLRANIEFEEEFKNIKKYNAAGIGLMRTESFFFNDGESGLKIEKQERFYESALKHSGEEPLTIRLFDVGGDKLFEDDKTEANPFLGWRGIRILLDHRELLRSQLEAILKVSGRYPNRCRILVPMICSIEEIKLVRSELVNAISRFKSLGIPYDEFIKLGIMVEVPSVAVMAEAYAEHVDFFSIGTNDLTQYTLAVDRGNNLISHLYQQMNPAVWQMIRMTSEAAHKKNIEVCVCGELASNPFAALILIGLGIDDLSMAPIFVPAVKRILHHHDMQQIKDLTQQVMEATDMTRINELIEHWKSSMN
ncbi:MAG: phosphoenolpyruvate--protein phosphotransferase [Balneolales bacterium]